MWGNREGSKCTEAARLPFSIITLPYSCCAESINSVAWIEGGGKAAGGVRGEQGSQRIVKPRSRFRPVQISPPRVPGSSDKAVRLPSLSPRTGCSLCSSLPHKAQLPVYKPHCHILAPSSPLPFPLQSCLLRLEAGACPTLTEHRAAADVSHRAVCSCTHLHVVLL